MAWTDPATAVTGDFITAAFWNTNGRDDLVYLHSLATGVITDTMTVVNALIGGMPFPVVKGTASGSMNPPFAEVEFINQAVASGTYFVIAIYGTVSSPGTSVFGNFCPWIAGTSTSSSRPGVTGIMFGFTAAATTAITMTGSSDGSLATTVTAQLAYIRIGA